MTTQTTRAEPVKPRGKAIKWTDEDIDRMVAEDTSDAGIEQAQADWNEKAPKDYKSLLDAEPISNGTTPKK